MLRPFLFVGLLAVVDVNAQLDALLKEVQPAAGWSWRLTPALPAEWPPKAGAAPVVRYVYAASFDPRVMDGERNSAPFARLDVAADGAVKVTQLTKTLEDPRIQGVRPITREEAALQSGELLVPAREGRLDALRGPWCAWKRNHGVVTQHLVARHAAFFEALGCK